MREHARHNVYSCVQVTNVHHMIWQQASQQDADSPTKKVESDSPDHHAVHTSSLLAKEEVGQEIGDVLIELILRGQEHGLVVDQQQEQVPEEQADNADAHDDESGNTHLLRDEITAVVQWLEQVAEGRTDD